MEAMRLRTDVALGDNHETNVVIDRAFPVIRERILEANTADVDSVSAATSRKKLLDNLQMENFTPSSRRYPYIACRSA